jgi:hypothetical protein
VAKILNKKKVLKDLIKLTFEDLTPYPPLHEMERGNKGGEVRLLETQGFYIATG